MIVCVGNVLAICARALLARTARCAARRGKGRAPHRGLLCQRECASARAASLLSHRRSAQWRWALGPRSSIITHEGPPSLCAQRSPAEPDPHQHPPRTLALGVLHARAVRPSGCTASWGRCRTRGPAAPHRPAAEERQQTAAQSHSPSQRSRSRRGRAGARARARQRTCRIWMPRPGGRTHTDASPPAAAAECSQPGLMADVPGAALARSG